MSDEYDIKEHRRVSGELDRLFTEHDGKGEIPWVSTTWEVANYYLNVLPPIYGSGKFACSEPVRDNHAGEAVYTTFRRVDSKANTAECRYCTVAEIKAA
jgi:hypothetical protein